MQVMNREEAKEYLKSFLQDYLESKGIDTHHGNFRCIAGKHQDKNPSMGFNPNGNQPPVSCHCFSCGEVFDIYGAIGVLDNKTGFNEQLEYAANMYGVQIEGSSFTGKRGAAQKKAPAPVTTTAPAQPQEEQKADIKPWTDYYEACAKRIQDTEYHRGISLETLQAYNVGFDPIWINHKAPNTAPSPRLIIPVTPYAYIARYAGKRITNYSKVKVKAEGLDAENWTYNREALQRATTPIWIVEGELDALSIIDAGGAAVGTGSLSYIRQLVTLLKEHKPAQPLLISLDNESSPQVKKKTDELTAELDNLGITYYLINAAIPAGAKDANEAMNKDKEAFRKYITEVNHATPEQLREIEQEQHPEWAEEWLKEKQQRDNELDEILGSIYNNQYMPQPTGLKFFDDLIGGGVVSQQLLLLLAAPAVGKTTFCQQLAAGIAEAGREVVYLNFEMSQAQLIARNLSMLLRRDKDSKERLSATQILRANENTPDQQDALNEAISYYREKIHPYLLYNPVATNDIDEITKYLGDKAKDRMRQGKPAPIVVADYIHLIQAQGLDGAELIKKVVTSLKEYAIEYNTYVIGIVAVGRESGKGRIDLFSGRDSSNLEYTADYQISLNYTDIDTGTATTPEERAKLERENPRRLTLRVLKARYSQSGKETNILFDAENSYFYYDPFSKAEPVDKDLVKNIF